MGHSISSAIEYHRRTAHGLNRYSRGPETLDWDLQPTPFRQYEGCAKQRLLHVDGALARGGALAELLSRPLGTLRRGEPRPAPLDVESLGVLLELAFGITAWKTLAGDRWAVRANPSSGNLHPVEVYVVCENVTGLADGVFHYCPLDHALEQRATRAAPASGADETKLGLLVSTVPWRESWKYGERAFRYCQLDVGHAAECAAVAAAALDWTTREESVPWPQMQELAGLDRREDFPKTKRPETEWEEAELYLSVAPRAVRHREGVRHGREMRQGRAGESRLPQWMTLPEPLHFHGRANLIDRHPLYSWPLVSEVMSLTRPMAGLAVSEPTEEPLGSLSLTDGSDATHLGNMPAERPTHAVLRQRRSAQGFDGKTSLSRRGFERVLASMQALEFGDGANHGAAPLELVLWVHRVETLDPGVYLFRPHPEEQSVERSLRRLRCAAPVQTSLPGRLWLLAPLAPNVLAAQARTLHCHQDIAAMGCLTLGLFTDLEQLGRLPAFSYRLMLRSAGRLVHRLYLGAELEGLRGTGIGCFFDEAVAEFLGLSATSLRSVYHFCMGSALEDPRVHVGHAYVE